jgi:hypothetical protein
MAGAVCPERGAGAALVLPARNCEVMQLHLDEIATKVAPRSTRDSPHQAGWHSAKALVVPSNVSLLPLPPRAPEPGKHLAVHRAELVVKPDLQILRRYRRLLLLRLEHTHRPRSCPSRDATGQQSVTQPEAWYKLALPHGLERARAARSTQPSSQIPPTQGLHTSQLGG